MIKIIKAYENNLKNISVNIPLNKITFVTGVSGSGKSTLIYNILANEAKRKEKIDSGKASCIDFAIRAKFDKIENLPYVRTLKQRALKQSISSTLATMSNLHLLLREEFNKNGEIIGEKGNLIKEPKAIDIKKFIQKFYPNEKFEYFAVICNEEYTDGKKEVEFLKKFNIEQVIIISSFDNKEKLKFVKDIKKLNEKYHYTILLPFHKLDDIEKYEKLALKNFLFKGKNISFNFYVDFPDIETGKIYQRKSISLLSFNSTSKFSGKCSYCQGNGIIENINKELLFNKLKLDDKFINIPLNNKGMYKYIILYPETIIKELRKNNININQTYYNLNEQEQELINKIIFPRIFSHRNQVFISKFLTKNTCPICNGTRLNYKANAVKLYNKSISELLELSIDELYNFFEHKKLHYTKILSILNSLRYATLGYLTLNRTTDTLSGGELQRLKLAIELNEEYKNLLYILDEPSTGLHPYNNYQIINLIKELKNKGNTIVLSEHNLEYIKNSDFVIELGPKGGKEGGKVIFQGVKKEVHSITINRKKLPINLKNAIMLNNVNINNIKNENFIIPLNCLVAITGVSGSGKSSLIHKALIPVLTEYLNIGSYDKKIIEEVKNIDLIKNIVELTQSQIGNTPRSIIATYLDIFDYIRDLFSKTMQSKEMGLDKSYFSFNSESGRCEICRGMGEIDEMVCSNCLGQRYKPEVLEITYENMNIYEFLNTTIDILKEKIQDRKLLDIFEIFEKLGLSYLTLGRTTFTLSGGESQRIRLIKILLNSQKQIKKGNMLFVFDEPTAGLNNKDIAKLYDIFDEILSYQNSIIVIEHNLNVIRNSDFIIDIGIGSGTNGGKKIFNGNYEELLSNKDSLTAKAFRQDLKKEDNKLIFEKNSLQEKVFNTQNKYNCNEFYLNDNHFLIEKQFAQNYKVLTDNNENIFFKTKEDLFEFTDNLNIKNISFNPYTNELFKYKKVPLSFKKDKIKYLKQLGFNVNIKDYEKDEWQYRISLMDIKKAYNFGKGWLTVETDSKTYELFTRLISMENKIIGSPKINEHIFSLYLNSCLYCNGTNKKQVYNEKLFINADKSILDKDFFKINLKINLKRIITKLKNELLFDFSKPFNKLNQEEKNIFLLGFKEYQFLKPNAKSNNISDYLIWKGLYSYIYNNLNKMNTKDKELIKNSQHEINCPFCNKGFKKEVNFYLYNNKTILDYI